MFLFVTNLKRSSLFQSAGVYTFANIINGVVPFLLLPIITRYLTPEDYGTVSMFTMITSITTIFIGLSINGAIARQYYEKDSTDISVYIGNCFYILFISTIVIVVLFVSFSDIISRYTRIPSNWLWAVVLFSFSQFVVNVMLLLLQVQVKPIKYGLIQISQTALNFVLSIFFVVYMGMNWKGRVSAQLLSVFVFSIIAFIMLSKNNCLKFKLNFSYIRNAISFGVPLIPHAFGGLTITMVGRFMITNMVSISETGLYTVGVQIGSVISMLAVSFNNAYVPWLFKNLKNGSYAKKVNIVKLTYVYFVLIILLALFLTIFSPWLLNFFVGKSFFDSNHFVLWTAMGASFQGMYYMVTNYIFLFTKNIHTVDYHFCSFCY